MSRGYVLKNNGKTIFYQPNDVNEIKATWSDDKSKVISVRYGDMLFKRVK